MSENKETILVTQFVKEYSEIANEGQRKQYLKKHITRTYCPLLEKMNMLKVMNEKSVVNNENGKYIDMTVSKLNTVISILILYTDIRIDKYENEKPQSWLCYDLLKSTKLLNKIIEFIGEDIEELMLVQKEIMDTWYTQNTSVEAFVRDMINKAVDRFGMVSGIGMEELSKILDDEVKLHKAMSTLEKTLKKLKK